ncbi:MAG: NAD(P)H-hydrate dehydratase [Proteobacteria bacterium]|nr:NAD(P)H-hydrate dehydratase [Pseudomonadota bacterium]
MPNRSEPILTAAQMRAAEGELIAQGVSVDALMQRAGRGAADHVWRLSGGRPITVLCGPGNNGGDGYVLAEAIRERGGEVAVITAADPATPAAIAARKGWHGPVLNGDATRRGDVLVDCLFGTGLTRPLSADHLALLQRLAASHERRVAVDLPSGVDSDLGLALNHDLPGYDLTVALGAWKFAHFLMPSSAAMGALRLVDIGVTIAPGAAVAIGRPRLTAPAVDAHKYTRGLLGVIGGAMPGAALLAARAAQHAGAGYIKLLANPGVSPSPDLVTDSAPLAEALGDARFSALLIGPGLGRRGEARERLTLALAEPFPAVLDADALVLLAPRLLAERAATLIVTPHEGELHALERAFNLDGAGSKVERASALAGALNAVVVAKGPDTVVASPDGRLALAHPATSWLATAGTGDVLAGTIASRLATGADPFVAACQGVWLHGEAARLCPPAFTAGQLAEAIGPAYAACL